MDRNKYIYKNFANSHYFSYISYNMPIWYQYSTVTHIYSMSWAAIESNTPQNPDSRLTTINILQCNEWYFAMMNVNIKYIILYTNYSINLWSYMFDPLWYIHWWMLNHMKPSIFIRLVFMFWFIFIHFTPHAVIFISNISVYGLSFVVYLYVSCPPPLLVFVPFALL